MTFVGYYEALGSNLNIMFYVVAYDIPDDRRRNKLFKVMKGFGIHTQFSVFECTLDDKEFIRMVRKIESVIDKKEDDIKIYPLCNNCLNKVESHGKAVLNKEEDVIVI